MTFTEAAIEVLRREGKPLHFKKIAEIAVRDSLLDHVGKVPEDVMGGQLATHCKLPHSDRKVVAVQPGTFALVEWGLDEDPAGLENLIELPPEDELPYRPRERHPAPSREMARSSGRGEARPPRRREEAEERRGRRYPPPAEVAFEILAGADHPLSLSEIAAQGAERLLMPDAFVRDAAALSAALLEDNKRRESAGRRPLFALDGEHVALAAQPEPGERAATPLVPVRPPAPADLRKNAFSALRRRLEACDPPTVEHVFGKLLEQMGVRELKVAKRGRDHVVYTGRRKLGLAEVRHCFRMLRGGAEPGRRDVTDARRDVGNYGAQIGIVLSTGEAGREARSEATAAGQLPVLLLCGEALTEAFTEHAVGCQPVVVPEVDEAFFRTAAEVAQQEEAARRARREERERREGRDPREPREARDAREPREMREPREPREPREGRTPREGREPRGEREVAAEREIVVEREVSAEREPREGVRRGEEADQPTEADAPIALGASVEVSLERGVPPSLEPDDVEEDGEEGDDEDVGESAAPPAGAAGPEGERLGEGRRRRRRRRRRGGRGRHREGAAGEAAPGAPGATPEASGGAAALPVAEAAPAPAREPSEPAGAPAPPGTDAPQGGER